MFGTLTDLQRIRSFPVCDQGTLAWARDTPPLAPHLRTCLFLGRKAGYKFGSRCAGQAGATRGETQARSHVYKGQTKRDEGGGGARGDNHQTISKQMLRVVEWSL